jgi:tetratricopeptide (TPR) repeat protein
MIRYYLFCTILAGLFSLTAFAQNDDTGNTIGLARKLMNAGEYTRALVTLEDLLVKDPANLDAQELKINILVQQEREKEALRDVEEYIRMYPGKAEFLYLRAVLNMQKEKYARAIEDFNTALQLDMKPELTTKIYLNRGTAHFRNQDFDQAENDFNEVIALDPKNAAAYHGRGMVKYELNQYEEAITEFQKALKIEKDNPITHYNIAMSYFRMKETEKACYHFNESCVLGHRNACRLLMMECDIKLPE